MSPALHDVSSEVVGVWSAEDVMWGLSPGLRAIAGEERPGNLAGLFFGLDPAQRKVCCWSRITCHPVVPKCTTYIRGCGGTDVTANRYGQASLPQVEWWYRSVCRYALACFSSSSLPLSAWFAPALSTNLQRLITGFLNRSLALDRPMLRVISK